MKGVHRGLPITINPVTPWATVSVVLAICVSPVLMMNLGHSPEVVDRSSTPAPGSQGVIHRSATQGLQEPAALVGGFLERPALSASGGSPVLSIPVGIAPEGIAYDAALGEEFVANAGSNNVSVLSDATNTVVHTVNVGDYPEGIAVDVSKDEAFVANKLSNNVSIISDTTNDVVATLAVGDGPDAAAYDAGQGEVFVANFGSGTVSVISETSDSVVATVRVGAEPTGVAYDSGKAEVFVANHGSANLSVISDVTNTVVASIQVGGLPYGLAYDSGKGEILETDSYGGPVVNVVSDSSNSVVNSIPVGPTPYNAAYVPQADELFVTNFGSDNVSVISDVTDRVIASVPVGLNPWAVAYDSGKAEVLVANSPQSSVSGCLYLCPGTVSVIPVGLAVAAASNVTSGPAYLQVAFTGTAVGGSWTYTSWNWSFGDGGTSTAKDPSHVYTVPGSYPVTANVTDSNGSRATSPTIWISVSRPTPFTASILVSRVSVDVGEPTWLNTSTFGGVSPFSFSYSSPPSSAGCNVPSGASVVCVPSQAGVDFAISVKVTDAYGATSNATSASVSVAPALRVTLSLSNSTPLLGASLAVSVTASGGEGVYTYSFLDLPPGCVSVNRSGLGCLPTQAGFYNITTEVTDQNQETASATVELHVIFDFTVVVPSQTTIGHPMTIQVESSPGVGSLTYSYTGLPPGCASQNSSTLTCTPSQVGEFKITISVHDQAGDHATHQVEENVVPAGFLGLSGNEGYYLVGVVVIVGLVGAIAAIRTVGRGPWRSAEGSSDPMSEIYAEYAIPSTRADATNPPSKDGDTSERGGNEIPKTPKIDDPLGDLM